MPETLVFCGGMGRPGVEAALQLALEGRSRNITLKLEDISKRLVRNVPDLLIDLIEIATYVYCADHRTGRGGECQTGMGSAWRREFRFVIPVRNPDYWSRDRITEMLSEALGFLSDDKYAFEFERATNPVQFESYLDLGDEDSKAFKADEVLLFSGGLDSLAGSVEELSDGRKKVALVSHRSSPKIYEHQKRLRDELKRRFPARVMHFPVQITKHGIEALEHTQRSRSFLYASIAFIVAYLLGNTRIRFFENGVVSINLPIAEQVVGSRATRTTHPLVLEKFRAFFSTVASKSIEIESPYIWKAKADVVRTLAERNCGDLIRDSVSCTRTHDATKLHTHCGCCSQCIDRRFGVLAADCAKHDPEEMYKVDLLTGARVNPADQTMAESYVRTALELREMSELAFFGRFGGESSRACSGFPSLKADAVAEQVLGLHRRHGQGIWDVLRRAIGDHSDELLQGTLPLSSVLMMAIPRGATLAISKVSGRADPVQSLADGKLPVASQGGDGTANVGGAPDRASRASNRNKPAFELARGIIEELYPDGVPEQSSEPNAILCGRVGERLKAVKQRNVSDDTILRAAGRRK
jgi:7-cyano-7-deazaguanine synthase in queuosine biosynthesis